MESFSAKFDLTGFNSRMAYAPELAIRAVEQQLYREATDIMAASVPLVPVLTGALRASGHVELPVSAGPVTSVTFGYGGPAVGYSVPVHERLDVAHTTGQAKYLEKPFREAVDRGMGERVMRRAREALHNGRVS